MFFKEPWFVCFAPFDLKNATIAIEDGFGETEAGGSEETPKARLAASAAATSMSIEQLNVAAPIGGRFTVTGSTATHEITARTIASADANEVQNLDIDATGGTYTLTFRGATTSALAHNANNAAVQAALEALTTIGSGNVAVSAGTDHVITFQGDLAALSLPLITAAAGSLTGGASTATITRTTQGTKDDFTTTAVSFTPGLTGNVSALAAITLLPVRLEIKLGEGNMEFDETRELEYFRDRGRLDTVREGDEQPVEVSFSATWEFIKSLAGATTPTWKEALMGEGPAEDWYSSSQDPCEPYAVDVVIIQSPDAECNATLGTETITLEDFRWTSFGHSAEDGEIAVEGSCNRTKAVVTRVIV